MDSNHLNNRPLRTQHDSVQILTDLQSVGADVHHRLFSADAFILSDQSRSVILSLMDSLLAQIDEQLGIDPEMSSKGVTLRLATLFAEQGLVLFLLSRFSEWNLLAKTNHFEGPSQIHPVLAKHLREGGIDKELAAQTISANARFAHNMEQFDLSLDELPAELLHDLVHSVLREKAKEPSEYIVSLFTADEAKNRLVLNAKCVEKFASSQLGYQQWRDYGPILFALYVSNHLHIAYDNLILATALQSPWIFMLSLRACGMSPEDIVLILAEMPKGNAWISADGFADSLKALSLDYDAERSRETLSKWNAEQLKNNIPYCGFWPWFGTKS